MGRRQKAEDGDAGGRSDVDVPIHFHGRDEFVADTEAVTAVRRLVAVVEFMRKVGRIVSVQHARAASSIFDRPDDSVCAAVCRDGRGSAGVSEHGGRYTRWRRRKQRICNGKSSEVVIHACIVDGVVEVSRPRPGTSRQSTRQFLIEACIARTVVAAEVVAVGYVNVRVFTGADDEVVDIALRRPGPAAACRRPSPDQCHSRIRLWCYRAGRNQ
jgi:hypothetical protein